MPTSFDVLLFLIFFIYGLAFWGMGLILALESGRSPVLADTRILRPLALFGMLHGTHEWLEAYLLQAHSIGISMPTWLDWLRLGLLVASFSSLLAYGIRSFKSPEYRTKAWWKAGLIGLFVYGMGILVSALTSYSVRELIQLPQLDVLSRYLLAVPGAVLAALALQFKSKESSGNGLRKYAHDFRAAAIGFGIYAFSQLVVQNADMFPANYINTDNFRLLTGIPVQLIRSAMAVIITLSLFRASQRAEKDRAEQLFSAQQSKYEALERVQKELTEKELLRRELLRHIVQAQEDERARIARELHDETAQTLAAISLDLATLQALSPDQPECKQISTRLLKLSKEMSSGLYRLVHDLRPAQLDDLGLIAALQYLVEQDSKANGLDVHFIVEGKSRRLDVITETVLFRVTQEALVNVSRHSGTNHADVKLMYMKQEVLLTVQDSGIGFDPKQRFIPPHGWGLTGMRERVEAVGGDLHIESAPGKGTHIAVSVPVFDLIP